MAVITNHGTTRADLRVHIRTVLSDGLWHTAYDMIEGTCFQPTEATSVLRLLLKDGVIESRIVSADGFKRTRYRLKGAPA